MPDASIADPRWDFFIAHASADTKAAERLYELLTEQPHLPVRVFLDTKSLTLGDDWDTTLLQAQRCSKITLVLVSSHSQSAYYQREEIAAAIEMARDGEQRHRVVPILIGAVATNAVPYGLRLKHGLRIDGPDRMQIAAHELLDLLEDMDRVPERILAARTKAVEEDHDVLGELSLASLTERTSKGTAAIRAFVTTIETLVLSGARTLDFIEDRRERARLRELLGAIMMIRHSQAPLPWLLRGYAAHRSKGRDNWRQVTNAIADLTPKVAEATELLASTNGPFVLAARNAYKSLLFTLHARSDMYAKLTSLPRPKSAEDFAQLERLAEQYDLLISELAQAEEAIVKYLGN